MFGSFSISFVDISIFWFSTFLQSIAEHSQFCKKKLSLLLTFKMCWSKIIHCFIFRISTTNAIV